MGEAVLVPKDTVEHGSVLSKFSEHVKKVFGGKSSCYSFIWSTAAKLINTLLLSRTNCLRY
jgi:hypothetical protein